MRIIEALLLANVVCCSHAVDLTSLYTADAVRGVLNGSEPEVLRAAMRTLPFMYQDSAHYPSFGPDGGFEPGSTNATLLEYWRNRL